MSDTSTSGVVPAAAARAFEEGLGVSSAEIARAQPVAVSAVPTPAAPSLSPERPETEEVKQSRPITRLAEHVRSVFQLNASYRRENGVDERLENSRLISSRRYSQTEKEQIALAIGANAKPLFFGWAESKRHAMASTLGEINNGSGEKPWTLAVTPRPDVPEMVKANALELSMEKIREFQRVVASLVGAMQSPEKAQEILPNPALMTRIAPQMLDEAKRIEKEQAEEACARMEQLIWDQMVEGGFNDAFADMVEYLTIYGSAIIVGPIPRTRRKLVRKDGPDGRVRMAMEDKFALEFESVPPVDCYPSPGARKATDGELIIRRRFSPADLAAFARAKEKEAKGWRRDAVDAILTQFPNGGIREDERINWQEYDYEKEAGQVENRSCQIEGLEYFGQVRGSELLGAGLTKDAGGKQIKGDEYYEVDCLTIMDLVVFCRIMEPEIGRPISKFEFYRTPESWWSEGVLDRCADPQRMSNGFIRSMAVNAAQASGPQVIVDRTRLESGKSFVARPWAVNYVVPSPMGTVPSGVPPVQFINVPSNMGDLMQGYSFCKTQGDELSELPAFTYGNTAGASSGITRTASVLAMLTEGATRGAKHSVRQIDEGTREMVLRCYHWNMLHHPDESVKVGDVTCNPSGVMGYLYVENNYNKVLQYMQITGNPTDMQIIGAKGRAYLLREIAKLMQLNPDKIVPTVEELELVDSMNKAKEQAALEQQEANVEATQAGTEGVQMRNAEGGEPSAPVAQAPEEETAATPGVGHGVNDMRARQAAAKRAVEEPGPNGPGANLTPQQRSIIAATNGNPRARAMAGARAAAARRGR